jgi:hypothetical protein
MDKVDSAIRSAAVAQQQAQRPVAMRLDLEGGRAAQVILPADTTPEELVLIVGTTALEGRRLLAERAAERGTLGMPAPRILVPS